MERSDIRGRTNAPDFTSFNPGYAGFPRMGHAGHDEGTLVPRLPYIVVYEIDDARGEVIVTAVFHGAENGDDEP